VLFRSTLVVTGNTTAGGTLTVDTDSAVAFVVQEEDATAMLTCDTTQDAGDTSMLLTTKVTTGTGFHIDGSKVTSGDALKITVAAATMTSAGAALSIVADGTEVFAVRDDGALFSLKGTAEGTTALGITTGDLVVSDGDLTVAGGEVAFTSDSTTAGLVIVNNTFTTGAALVDVSSTSITTGALMRLNANTAAHDGEVLEIINAGDTTSTGTGISVTMPDITTGAATGIDVVMAGLTTTGFGIKVTMDAITTGDMLYLDNGGGTMTAGSGFYINCNDDNTSVFTVSASGATTITGTTAAASLSVVNNTFTTGAALVDISSTSITTGALMRLNANTTAHDGEVLEIINAGDTTSTGAGITVTMPDITSGAARGIDVTMVGLTTTGFGIKVTMDAITTGDMLYLDNGGDTLTAGSGFFINCNDDNTSKFTVSKHGATTIAGTAAGTTAFTVSLGDIVVVDTDASTITSANGTGTALTVTNTDRKSVV